MGITDRIEGVSLKKQIREGKYEFSSPHWDNISNEGNFISVDNSKDNLNAFIQQKNWCKDC